MTLRDQADRRLGFEQVISREYGFLKILPVIDGRDDSTVTIEVVRQLLRDRDDLIGLYNIGAGNRGVIEALEESQRKDDIAVVVHELTRHARRALVSGTFDAVISRTTRSRSITRSRRSRPMSTVTLPPCRRRSSSTSTCATICRDEGRAGADDRLGLQGHSAICWKGRSGPRPDQLGRVAELRSVESLNNTR